MFFRFWLANALRITAACHFSTSQLPNVVCARQLFNIFTCKCASCHSDVPFFDIRTSNNGPTPSVFLALWLENAIRTTVACDFSTPQLPKVVQWWFFYILTWKCASRHSGVSFFHIRTCKNGPNLGVHFFMSHLATRLRTRCFSEPIFRPSRAANHSKNMVFHDFLTFYALAFSFFWLFLFLSSTLPLCFSSLHIVGSLTFKLPLTSLYYKVFCTTKLCMTKYYKVWHSTSPYYKVLLCIPVCYKVFESFTNYDKLLLCTSKYFVLESTTKYHSVLQSTTPYYSVLQSTLLQSITR